ncbi:MAG: hypothetical protein NXH70_07770 [Hyphomonas sp.]|nr:hypothetical protein [Hyphomonas sp.]
MTPVLSFSDLFSATIAGARQIVVPTLGFAAAFVAAIALMVWGAEVFPQSTAGSIGFLLVVMAAVTSHSLFSAAMYRRLVPFEGTLLNAAWKLTLAWILIAVVAAILFTTIVLFFSLIGSSLGVVSGEAGQDITDMTAQMREGGTFYPLFALFLLTLLGVFWFVVRMMLFAAATASRGTVHVFRTWSWTKGYALSMAIGAMTFIVLPASFLGYASSSAMGLSQSAAISAGIVALVQLPAAWLGHAYAAAVYTRLAPNDPATS